MSLDFRREIGQSEQAGQLGGVDAGFAGHGLPRQAGLVGETCLEVMGLPELGLNERWFRLADPLSENRLMRLKSFYIDDSSAAMRSENHPTRSVMPQNKGFFDSRLRLMRVGFGQPLCTLDKPGENWSIGSVGRSKPEKVNSPNRTRDWGSLWGRNLEQGAKAAFDAARRTA